jgi:hypothetical protein
MADAVTAAGRGWKPTGGGNYTHPSGASVSRSGKSFVLSYRGKTVDLGKKATFPRLQAAAVKLGVGNGKSAASKSAAGSGKGGGG